MIFVGLDIGGTNTRAVAMDARGVMLARRRVPTLPQRGATDTIDFLVTTVKEMLEEAGGPLISMGIGITGPVDLTTGVVSNPYTLGGWPPTDIREPFAEAFNVPVTIDNDANVAAIGEWWLGAGRGVARMTMVTIGTGIGVATLLDGQVQRTSAGRHGEAGHMVLNPAGPECYCGARGCWEVLGSGTALQRKARELALNGDEGGMIRALANGDPNRIDGDLLLTAAAAGDRSALRIVDETASSIGLGLVNLASTIMPDLFVLSGGVMDHIELFRPEMENVMRRHSTMIPTDVPILAASLGDDAGALGAAKQALDLSKVLPV
jgi:glucokinase